MPFLGHPVSLSRKTLCKASNRHHCRYFRQPQCQKAQADDMCCWTTKLQGDSVFCSHRETCKANVEKFGFLKKSTHLPLKGMHEWRHFQIYFPAWQQRFSFSIHHPTSVPRSEASDKQLNFPPLFYSTRANNKNRPVRDKSINFWAPNAHSPALFCFAMCWMPLYHTQALGLLNLNSGCDPHHSCFI